jgi:DNA-binding response OmpR family regulator
MAAVLLVEDDPTIGDVVRSALTADAHTVAWVRTGVEAEARARGVAFDVILLDLGLPDCDGIDLCGTLRSLRPDAMLIMLTARRQEMDVVVGLEAGADDYLTKPFGVSELLARVRAHLRRAAHSVDRPDTFTCDDLTIDFADRRCFVAGQEVRLRTKEFDLLARLAAAPGEALSRETLMSDVWSANWFGSTKTLDVHLAAVRRHLQEAEASAGRPLRIPEITTLRGYGYRLEAPRAETAGTSSAHEQHG